MELSQRLDIYKRLTRLDKPIGSLLLLWPTLWGLWFAAEGVPNIGILFIFVLGTLLMRSAGCVVNDYADKDFDPHVERTKTRPLAAREISTKEALLLAAALALTAFLLILPLNFLVVVLSFPALLIAASYPYTKRFLAIPQAYLGIAFGFGIPMAFAAVRGEVPALAWIILIANSFWTLAYDTEYAMVDRDDDLKIGIKTAAITFGQFDVIIIMLCYATFLGLLTIIGTMLQMGTIYYFGLGIALAIAGYHYVLIRERKRENCFKAFLHNNWIGGVVFVSIAMDYFGKRYIGNL